MQLEADMEGRVSGTPLQVLGSSACREVMVELVVEQAVAAVVVEEHTAEVVDEDERVRSEELMVD